MKEPSQKKAPGNSPLARMERSSSTSSSMIEHSPPTKVAPMRAVSNLGRQVCTSFGASPSKRMKSRLNLRRRRPSTASRSERRTSISTALAAPPRKTKTTYNPSKASVHTVKRSSTHWASSPLHNWRSSTVKLKTTSMKQLSTTLVAFTVTNGSSKPVERSKPKPKPMRLR